MSVEFEETTNQANTKGHSYQKIEGVSPSVFCEDTYSGSGGYLRGNKSYLIPNSREVFYKLRVEHSFFRSYLKPVINATFQPVFSEIIERVYSTKNALWDKFLEDSTNGGASLDEFIKESIKRAQIQGLVAIVMDNFTDQATTESEAIEGRKLPYTYLRSSSQINFELTDVDKFGNLEKITFIEAIDPKDQEPIYRSWNDLGWLDFKMKGDKIEVLDEGLHNLGAIPVRLIITGERKDSKDLANILPPFYQIAVLNSVLFQVDSEVRFLSNGTRFPILAVSGFSDVDSVTLSSRSILNVGEGGTNPSYIEPSIGLFADGREEAEKIRESIYQLAEQNGVLGNTKQSAVSKAYDFFAQESVLKGVSKLAQDLDNWIQKLFGLYINKTIEGASKFPLDFQPTEGNEILNEADIFSMLSGVTENAKRVINLQAFDSLTSGNDEIWVDTARKEMIAEIEQGVIDAEILEGGLDTPNDIEAEAKAKLKGSVGGVQGILNVQKSVAEGFTSYDAGVNTLVTLYGFDEATSKALLGSPKSIKPNQVIDE